MLVVQIVQPASGTAGLDDLSILEMDVEGEVAAFGAPALPALGRVAGASSDDRRERHADEEKAKGSKSIASHVCLQGTAGRISNRYARLD
jgi:hypothetical protein